MLGLTTAATAAVLAFGGLSASSALASAGSLNGAGSTLVNPLMQDWVNGDAANVTVAYNPVGSGTGITDLINKLVDFAGSDAPLTATQQTNCNNAQGSTCVMMPWGLTATGVSFNLPGISYVKHRAGSDLPRRDQDVERSGAEGAEPGREPPGHADQPGVPQRRLG
jgi:phosphate transport system substrate-binding protein